MYNFKKLWIRGYEPFSVQWFVVLELTATLVLLLSIMLLWFGFAKAYYLSAAAYGLGMLITAVYCQSEYERMKAR